MKHSGYVCWMAGIVLLVAVSSGFSDEVIFKNGRTMVCTVVAIKPKHVVINMGGGTMNIPKSEIQKIRKSPKTKTSDKKDEWDGGNILSEKNAPKAYASLAADFRSIMRKRNEAYDANYMIGVHEQEVRELKAKTVRLTRQIAEMEQEHATLRKQHDEIKLPTEVPRQTARMRLYNQMLKDRAQLDRQSKQLQTRIDALKTEHTETENRIPKVEAKRQPNVDIIKDYSVELAAFVKTYKPQKSNVDLSTANAAEKELFSKIDETLLRFIKELKRFHLNAELQ